MGYQSSSDIDRLKLKKNNDLLKKDIDDQINPQKTNFAELANYFSASSTFKDNEWSDLGLAVTYTSALGRDEIKISVPTLIGEKYKDGSSITDKYGNIYINAQDFRGKGIRNEEAAKNIEGKMFELNQILNERKERHGGLDQLVNKLFIDTAEKDINDGSFSPANMFEAN